MSFTFASSPLSERLKQATSVMGHVCKVEVRSSLIDQKIVLTDKTVDKLFVTKWHRFPDFEAENLNIINKQEIRGQK